MMVTSISPFPTIFSKGFVRKGTQNSGLTHSHTMTPFDAPGKQAF